MSAKSYERGYLETLRGLEGNRTAADGIGSEAVTEFLILNISILGKLTDKELRAIEKYMNQMEVAPGEIVSKRETKEITYVL